MDRASAASHGLLIAAPVLFTMITAVSLLQAHTFAFDFHYAYWHAAQAVLHGTSRAMRRRPGTPARARA